MRRTADITHATVVASRASILEAADRLERETDYDPDRYLGGDALTILDISVASLLAPVVAPGGSPWNESSELPSSILELRDEMRVRPAGLWVLRRYRDDRRRPL